jgi:hypothetical protein
MNVKRAGTAIVKRATIAILIILSAGAIAGMNWSCSKNSKSSGKQTLYDSLGGTTMVSDPATLGREVEQGYLTIRTIVDTAIFIIEADSSIDTTYFSTLLRDDTTNNISGYENFSANLTNFLATAAGATDYTYTGLDMYAAHNPDSNGRIGAKVNSAAFNEFAYDIGQSAIAYGLNHQLISQIGDLLYKYEGQVVQH